MRKPQGSVSLEASGLSVLLANYVRCTPVLHCHDEPMLTFLLAGHCIETDSRGHSLTASPLDVYVQPRNFLHSHLTESPVTTVCALLGPEFVDKLGNRVEVLHRPAVLSSLGIGRTCRRIADEMARNDESSKVSLVGLFIELVGEMSRSVSAENVRLSPLWLREFERIIECHYSEKIGLESIAASLGMLPANLGCSVLESTGLTVRAHLRKKRTEMAVQLLGTTSLSVTEIAVRCGFSDHSHMARIVRSRYGTSLSQLRSMLRTEHCRGDSTGQVA